MRTGLNQSLVALLGMMATVSVLNQEALAQEAKETLEVYENLNDIVVVEPKGPKRLVTPKKLHANGRYLIRIKKPEPVAEAPTPEPAPAKEANLDERTRAAKLLFDANAAFFKGDIETAWNNIDEAEKLEPNNVRIKNMKGSILYKVGSKELAIPVWEQSLAINPDQPEIRQMLEKSKEEQKF